MFHQRDHGTLGFFTVGHNFRTDYMLGAYVVSQEDSGEISGPFQTILQTRQFLSSFSGNRVTRHRPPISLS